MENINFIFADPLMLDDINLFSLSIFFVIRDVANLKEIRDFYHWVDPPIEQISEYYSIAFALVASDASHN